MTPVETLREAARLMRERAEAATPGPWTTHGIGVLAPRERDDIAEGPGRIFEAQLPYRSERMRANTAHVVGMHPGVALAVADWLEAEVWASESPGFPEPRALTVARVYLGEAS